MSWIHMKSLSRDWNVVNSKMESKSSDTSLRAIQKPFEVILAKPNEEVMKGLPLAKGDLDQVFPNPGNCQRSRKFYKFLLTNIIERHF